MVLDDESWAMRYGNAPRPEDVVIVGAGGFGREVEQWIDDINVEFPRFNLLGFLDEDPTLPTLGALEWLQERPGMSVVLGVGDPKTRKLLVSLLEPHQVKYPPVVHPSARIGKRVVVGEGTVVCPDVTVTVDVAIGRYVHLNLDCTVGHDAIVGDYASLYPGVHVSGGVSIGDGATLGTGTVVRPSCRIGCWSMVGAGSVVIRDVSERCTVVGSPAREV